MFGFSTVKVSGSSMSPAYNQGDWLLVRGLSGKEHTLKIGSVYLIQELKRVEWSMVFLGIGWKEIY
jgi:signal peptidase I